MLGLGRAAKAATFTAGCSPETALTAGCSPETIFTAGSSTALAIGSHVPFTARPHALLSSGGLVAFIGNCCVRRFFVGSFIVATAAEGEQKSQE